jgi:hypothetical protein
MRWGHTHVVFWVAATAFLLGGAGCGSNGLSPQDEERARGALEKALTAWQKGEPAAKWTAEKAPVRFVDDDWIRGSRLTDFQIVRLTANRDGYPEAVVRLSLKSAKGIPTEQEALYGINVQRPGQVVIGRDPMH